MLANNSMSAEKLPNVPLTATEAEHRASFFRQSGWLMIANIAGGMLMYGVHFLAKSTGPAEYGIFMTFLAAAMCIPTMPLQMVLAQQTARTLATGRERELAGMIRLVCLGVFLLWLAASVLVLVFQGAIVERWKLPDAVCLWITLPILLFSLALPIFWGVLQGAQNFLWLGWSMMVNGIGRVAIAAVAVLAFHSGAAGMLMGILLGIAASLALAVWHGRALWLPAPLRFDWRSLLAQVIPLMIGFGAFQFLFTADTMFAKAWFNSTDVGFYGSAGTLSRALMWLVGPMATVMFPRIVHSAVRSEKSDLMGMVLIGTAVLAIGGAVGLSIVGPFVVSFVYGHDYVALASSVLPWYAAAMVPLALANVLLNNLLARSSFRVVPALCVLVVVYAFALTRFHATLVMVLQTLGVANLLLLAICAWYTWGEKRNQP